MTTPRDLAPPLDRVTLVVPTRDEAENIPAFVAALPPAVPLVVVDASRDATPRLVLELRPENTSVVRSRSGIAAARHLGALQARTPWLLFSDADVLLGPAFFARLAAWLARDEVDAVYGPKLSADRYRGTYRAFAVGQRLCHAAGIPAVSGSNLAVRASVYHAAGGFDPFLSCNEDSELGCRLARRGHRVRFDPQLAVHARDHRRLARGRTVKAVHTALRCAALYSGLLPERLRRGDWGYWRGDAARGDVAAPEPLDPRAGGAGAL